VEGFCFSFMLDDVVRNDETTEIHERHYPPLDFAPEECYYSELPLKKEEKIKLSERYIFRVLEPLLHDESLISDREVLLGCFSTRRDCFKIYMSQQIPWVEEAAYFIGLNDHVDDPQHSLKLIDQVTNQIGPEYRLYVLAKNPALLDLGVDLNDDKILTIRKFCSSLRLSKMIAFARRELNFKN
jgi:hypothetical protein